MKVSFIPPLVIGSILSVLDRVLMMPSLILMAVPTVTPIALVLLIFTIIPASFVMPLVIVILGTLIVPVPGGLISLIVTMSRAAVMGAITQMGGWSTGSEQLHQITSEGDAINLGAAAAYCAYYFRAYSHGIHGYTLYSSAGFGLFYVGYTNSFDPDPLCGRYSYDLVDYPGNYRTVPCCSSSASYNPCPMGWGRISDSDLFSDWGSNGTFPISDLNLLVSTPPQYLGRNDHIFYRRGFTRDSFVLLSPWFLSPVLGFSYYCPLAVLS